MHAQGREGDRRFNDLMVTVFLTSLHSLLRLLKICFEPSETKSEEFEILIGV